MVSSKETKFTPQELEKKLSPMLAKWIINIRVEIKETHTRKTIERVNKTKNWFFENISKIDKLLSRITKREERERGFK